MCLTEAKNDFRPEKMFEFDPENR